MSEACARDDLVERNIGWWLWRVPLLAFVVGILVGQPGRQLLWTPAFVVAGVACIVNARRCGRLHCFMTGPLYLIAAVATIAAAPWSWIAFSVVAGTIAAYAVERYRGKYDTAQGWSCRRVV
jgi:hypothetical protein